MCVYCEFCTPDDPLQVMELHPFASSILYHRDPVIVMLLSDGAGTGGS